MNSVAAVISALSVENTLLVKSVRNTHQSLITASYCAFALHYECFSFASIKPVSSRAPKHRLLGMWAVYVCAGVLLVCGETPWISAGQQFVSLLV